MQIRALYRQHTDTGGASQVNLQGIVFNTNDGGRLAIERYLAATFDVGAELKAAAVTSAKGESPQLRDAIAKVANKSGLNAKYLGILWTALYDSEPSVLLDMVRSQWAQAKPADAPALAEEIGRWQRALWRFTSVGHIGKAGGPKAWQEPVSPLVSAQEIRVKLPTTPGQSEVKLYLVAGDAGDGNAHDFVVWQQSRLVAAGRPDLLLRDVRRFTREMTALREKTFRSVSRVLEAADDAKRAGERADIALLAKQHGVEVDTLKAWLDCLGIGSSAALKLDHFHDKLLQTGGYDFITGWGTGATPLLLANSSDRAVRVPGMMKPHAVCVHPSPTLRAAIGWKAPFAGMIRVRGEVTHAHPECGNGVEWRVEVRRGVTRQRLAEGTAQGTATRKFGPTEPLGVQPGDSVSLLVGPRDGNHSCDLTDLEFVIKSLGPDAREWSLTRDVAQNVLESNPHADRFGNAAVWHFYTEPVDSGGLGPMIPPHSLLARWQAAESPAEKRRLATELANLFAGGPRRGASESDPDSVLYRQLRSLGGPLFGRAWKQAATSQQPASSSVAHRSDDVGLDPALFGRHPDGTPIDGASLCVQAPSVVEVRIPAELAEGSELVVTGSLDPRTGSEGSVQLQVVPTKPERLSRLLPIAVQESAASGPWTSNTRHLSYPAAIIVNEGSAARRRIEAAFADFRALFPLALSYTKIVPVDEVVTLTLYYREDEPLRRLMLDDEETRKLDRLWDELHFISHDALKIVDGLQQLLEFATQDADPKVFEPMKKPIHERAAAFRKALVDAEPKQVDALIDFAARAYRRPLTKAESDGLRKLYQRLRQQELPHDEAFRFTLARVLVSPNFLYRHETAPAGSASAPVSDWELATRLSYFLWASAPDAELRAAAANGKLHQPAVLIRQAKRMVRDSRVRRLATQFGCQWLHIYDFNALDEKSERHFPEFAGLRGDMYEESIRFLADLFQNDGSVLDLLNADHTFVNRPLARFYGIPEQLLSAPSQAEKAASSSGGSDSSGWGRVDGIQRYGRGGILGLATTLAKQSGASRTSPILRGNWVSEVLLGEKLPKPPKDVPKLPEDETATNGLTVCQMVERHVSDVRCSSCHQKFDGFGYALEQFDAIGRRRELDMGGRPIDVETKLPDGTEINGLPGLRAYLGVTRRDAFIHQFCRKLLGYALGRGVQLSDEPLLSEMQQRLVTGDYRFSVLLDTLLESRQFREIRGSDAQVVESR